MDGMDSWMEGWDTVTNESDIDLCWSNWQRTYLSIISQCVPQKLLPGKKHLPWISLSILKAIRKRNSLLNKYKRSGNQAILSLAYTSSPEIKHAFFKHLQTADDKTFWKLYKALRWHAPHSAEVNENINLGYSQDQGYS